jgi:hypothetical protein
MAALESPECSLTKSQRELLEELRANKQKQAETESRLRDWSEGSGDIYDEQGNRVGSKLEKDFSGWRRRIHKHTAGEEKSNKYHDEFMGPYGSNIEGRRKNLKRFHKAEIESAVQDDNEGQKAKESDPNDEHDWRYYLESFGESRGYNQPGSLKEVTKTEKVKVSSDRWQNMGNRSPEGMFSDNGSKIPQTEIAARSDVRPRFTVRRTSGGMD